MDPDKAGFPFGVLQRNEYRSMNMINEYRKTNVEKRI